VPGGFAAGLAGGMAGAGAAQDEAAKNAMQSQLYGLQGKELQSKVDIRNRLMPFALQMMGGADTGAAAPSAAPTAALPDTAGDTVVPPAGMRAPSMAGTNLGVGGATSGGATGWPFPTLPATAQFPNLPTNPANTGGFVDKFPDAVTPTAADYGPGSPFGRTPPQGLLASMGGTAPAARPAGLLAQAASGGTPQPASPMPAPAAVAAPPALVNGVDPRRLAGLGIAAGLGGIGDVFKPMENYYYNSPGYKGAVAGAEREGQSAVDLRYKAPLTAAERSVTEPSDIRIAEAKATQDRESKRLEQERAAGLEPTTLIVGNREIPVTRKQYADAVAGRGVPELGIPPLAAVRPGGAAATPAASSPFGKPFQTPGEITRDNARATSDEKAADAIIGKADKAAVSRASLLNLEAEAGRFVQGPFAPFAQKAASYLRLIDPKWNEQVGSYEAFEKNAGLLIRQAVRETDSNPAVQQFNMIRQSLPNPETSPQGLRKVVPQLIGIHDYDIASSQALRQYEQANGNNAGFQTWWQKQASPYAYMVARMQGDDRRELIAKLQGTAQGRTELNRLNEQLTFLTKNRLID
jgi:hypothetical protein